MKKTRCIFIAVLLMACSQSRGNFDGSDDFNGATLDLMKWSTNTFFDPPLSQQSGHLTFSTTGSYIVEELSWGNNFGSYTEDWSVTIKAEVNVELGSFSMSDVFAGMSVTPIIDGIPRFDLGHYDVALNKGKDLFLDGYYNGVGSLGAGSFFEPIFVTPFENFISIGGASSVELRLAFNAKTKTLHSYCNYSGNGFQEVAHMRILEWGMCSQDQFLLQIGCHILMELLQLL